MQAVSSRPEAKAMFYGTTIEELIDAVEKAERDSRGSQSADVPVRVTRYEVNPGFVYAMQFTEPTVAVGVA
jgi:hypothetical protein